MTPKLPLINYTSTVLLMAAAALAGAGCASTADTPGQLILSIETDMALPDQLDHLYVQVLVHGQVLFGYDNEVGGGVNDIHLPATFTLVAGKDPALSVTIRVAGSKAGQFRTFREVTTTVPRDRLAHLRVPLQWLCYDTATALNAETGPLALRSSCGDGHSCIAGRCMPSPVDEARLPNFSPQQVYGGGERGEDGTCFDTLPCMITGTLVQPEADCTVKPPQWSNLNVALRVAGGGICDDSGTICFVPLDGKSNEGWHMTSDGDRLQLPRAVCDKLETGLISGVYTSTYCPTKTAADPPCGKWSSVTTKGKQPPEVALARAPKVQTIARFDRDRDGRTCCPLLSDERALYTCTCPSGTDARLQRVELSTGGQSEVVASLPPPQGHARFAATLVGRDLYWVDDRRLRRVNLDSHVTADFTLDTTLLEGASLLHDDSALSTLANRPEGGQGSPVQLLRFFFDGTRQMFETGGNRPVYQFGQSADALYVAVDVDAMPDASDVIARESTVVRIDKRDGVRTRLAPSQHIETEDLNHGGYIGVQTGASSVYALFESASNPDGSRQLQLHRIESSGQTADDAPAVLYELDLDSAHTTLTLLGVVDDTPIVARIEQESSHDGTTVRSSSIFAVPSSRGSPRILADLAHDYPLAGLALDPQHIYLLSDGGTLFALAREGLP